MKKYILILGLFLINNFVSGQSVRNSLLGIYTGIYDPNSSSPVIAGVKVTEYPSDTSSIIINDTINNINTVLKIFLATDGTPPYVIDTLLLSHLQSPCGDVVPANDSMHFAYIPNQQVQPVGIYSIKCVLHTLPTSLQEINTPTVKIYPNPAINRLFISAEKDFFKTYCIYTIYGQQITSGILNTTIDISEFTPGIYYLKLIGKTELIKPFVKN